MQSGRVLFLQVAARREHARAEQILFITRWAAPLRNYVILLLFSQERRDAERASRAEGATTQLGAPGRHGGGQPRGRGARRGQGGVGDRLACRLLVHLVPSSHLETWWEWLACLSVLPGMLENVVLWKKHICLIIYAETIPNVSNHMRLTLL